MATIIHVHCDRCGTCNKPISTEVCVLVPNKPSGGRLPNKLNYVCTSCGEHNQVITAKDLNLLMRGGVLVETYDVPMEIVEPYPSGPQFTPDDMIDFHQELEHLPEWGIKL